MGCGKREQLDGGRRHRGSSSLFGLIFGIISLSVTLAFKITGIFLKAAFGLFSAIVSGFRGSRAAGETAEKYWDREQAAGFNSADDTGYREENCGDSKFREYKKTGFSGAKADEKAEESRQGTDEAQNRDLYIVLFVITIIPVTMALAMGRLLLAGIIGAAGFGMIIITGIVSRIAGSLKKRAEERESHKAEKEPEEMDSVEKLIKDAFDKIFEIRKDIGKIKDAEARARVEAICSTGEKIIGEVRTNPEGLTHVRKFFYYYLDAFGEIVRKYLKLSDFEESSEEVEKLIDETEKSFLDIEGIFRDLCEKLLEKDMMHLKAEINVIKNSN